MDKDKFLAALNVADSNTIINNLGDDNASLRKQLAIAQAQNTHLLGFIGMLIDKHPEIIPAEEGGDHNGGDSAAAADQS